MNAYALGRIHVRSYQDNKRSVIIKRSFIWTHYILYVSRRTNFTVWQPPPHSPEAHVWNPFNIRMFRPLSQSVKIHGYWKVINNDGDAMPPCRRHVTLLLRYLFWNGAKNRPMGEAADGVTWLEATNRNSARAPSDPSFKVLIQNSVL